MANQREITQGLAVQGADETITYTLTTTVWGSSPTSPSAKIYSFDGIETYADVTSTNMPTGSASVSGDIITLPPITALTADQMYRVEVQFTISGNVFEAYAWLLGER